MKYSIPTLNFSVKIKRLDEDYYLVKKNNAWKINSTSFEILSLCNGINSIDTISLKIAEKFSVSQSIVLSDCKDIFEFFCNEGLVEMTI